MLRIFITIAVGIATCERSVSKLKLIKNYSNMSTLRMRNVAIPSIEQQLTDEIYFAVLGVANIFFAPPSANPQRKLNSFAPHPQGPQV